MRGGRVVDEEGREVPGGGKGYRYFGRAKELPGVKELFEAASKAGRPQEDGERGPTRAALSKNVDANYYGYNLDEEDGTLLEYEEQQEREFFSNLAKQAESEKEKAPLEILPGDVGDGVGWRLPTTEEVQEELVERRRRRLLDKLG